MSNSDEPAAADLDAPLFAVVPFRGRERRAWRVESMMMRTSFLRADRCTRRVVWWSWSKCNLIRLELKPLGEE